MMKPASEDPNQGARILIIDDDPNLRSLLSETLVLSGYLVATAESGKKAIERLETEIFDLALVDLFLNDDVHGLQVVDYLRRKQPNTAVLVLTGFSSFETVLQSLRLGVDEYLVKPVEAAVLRDRIREALDKRRGQQPPAQVIREAAPDLPGYLPDHALLLEFGGLTINHQAGKATCLGLPLELNGPEFRLLCYLVQQAPRPISAVELLLEDPFDPALETHKLKGKLAGAWACSAGYDLRIVFDFCPGERPGERDILLINIGNTASKQ